MAQTILIKRSNTSNAIPSTSQLSLGELALNTADAKLYMRKYVDGTNANDTITLVGDNSTIAATTLTGNLSMGDNIRARFGTGNDLQIYHDGNNSYITDTGTGDLKIGGANVVITTAGGTKYFEGASNRAFLFHTGNQKLVTTAAGIDVTGAITANSGGGATVLGSHLDLGDNQKARFGASDDLQIYHTGTESWIQDAGSGNLYIDSNGAAIQLTSGGAAKSMINAIPNGGVTLFHNNSSKLNTNSGGVDVTGNITVSGAAVLGSHLDLGDNQKARFGASDDLQIYHDGTNSYIKNGTGDFKMFGAQGTVAITVAGGSGSAVSLEYGNSLRLQTTADGVWLPYGASFRSNVVALNYLNAASVNQWAKIGYFRAYNNFQSGLTDGSNFGGLEFYNAKNGTTTGATGYIRGIANGTTGNMNLEIQTGTAGSLTTKMLVKDAGVDVTGNIAVSGTVDGIDITARDAVLTSTTTTAGAALPKAGGAMTGAITTNSTFDGRDVATDGTKLDTIETSATADQTQSEINSLGITATGLSGTPAINVGGLTVNSAFTFPTADGSTNQVIKTDGSGNMSWATVAVGTPTYLADADNNTKIQVEESADENKIRFDTAGSERMIIDATGKVGIGTTSPSSQFVVAASNGGKGIETQVTTHASNNQFILAYDRANSAYLNMELSALNFGIATNNGTNRLKILANGNVGIGTDNPSCALDVTRTSGWAEMHLDGASGGDLILKDNNVSYGEIYAGNGHGMVLKSYASQDMYFLTNAHATSKMIIKSAGNVGIGTISPVNKLHVAAADGYSYLKLTSDTTGHTASDGARIGLNGNDLRIINAESANIIVQTANTERMRITSAGNVGIGTTAPAAKLHIKDTSTTGGILLTRESSSAGAHLGVKYQHSPSDSSYYAEMLFRQVDTNHGGQIEFWTDNSSGAAVRRMTINKSGHVGIGTDSPQAQLQVKQLGINVNQSSVTSTSQYACDSMSATVFRSARYTVQITNVTDSTYHITEILLIHNGTTPAITEFATIFTGSAAEATFDADINSGNVRLLATPASTDNMQFKVVRHSILV